MSFKVNIHHVVRAEHNDLSGRRNDTLDFIDDEGNEVTLFVPPHVASVTEAAFNRAMQAVPQDGTREGWTYRSKTGIWNITCPMPGVYQGQHDEITGDEDPEWMFVDGFGLIDCMDEIDRVEEEVAEEAA